MRINTDINNIKNNLVIHDDQRGKSFSQILKDALKSVNSYQEEYESLLERQIYNDEIDLHNVVIAGEKAKISLELALQVRNKAMEAYQEIMRMQV